MGLGTRGRSGPPSETGTETKRQGLSKPSTRVLHRLHRAADIPADPGARDFTAFRDVLTLMTNQARWASVPGAEGRATPSVHAVQVLGGTSRRKAAAVSIAQQFRGVT